LHFCQKWDIFNSTGGIFIADMLGKYSYLGEMISAGSLHQSQTEAIKISWQAICACMKILGILINLLLGDRTGGFIRIRINIVRGY
jgi:hypothetical protein